MTWFLKSNDSFQKPHFSLSHYLPLKTTSQFVRQCSRILFLFQ